ncbi:glycerol-3-phosphate dehydrogenase subunit GlpB [Vibrio fluvialis]
MMHYDVAVIGGGIAGYTAAIRSLQAGKKTVLISQGQSALHFSSGSIDVLAKLPDGSPVTHPFDALEALKQQAPLHPYNAVGRTTLQKGLEWFRHTLAAANVPLQHQDDLANHGRITPLGTLKATWLSQPFVYQHRSEVPFERIVVVSIDSYRDFQPQMLKDNLSQHPDFHAVPIHTVTLSIPGFDGYRRNPNELRSIDIARLLKQEAAWTTLCDGLMRVANRDDLVIMPAIMGNGDGLTLLTKLRATTQLHFHEVPTMPPSLLGIRIEEALSRTFIQLGGIHLKGDKVVNGHFERGRLVSLQTQNLRDMPISAEHYIMATGSYFSQGLHAEQHTITEPVFGLQVTHKPARADWRNPAFFADRSHPFMAFGVETNAQLNPTRNGEAVRNLYCCGSMLAGYDPVFEGCGGGVAIGTAYHAIMQCINPQVPVSHPKPSDQEVLA